MRFRIFYLLLTRHELPYLYIVVAKKTFYEDNLCMLTIYRSDFTSSKFNYVINID